MLSVFPFRLTLSLPVLVLIGALHAPGAYAQETGAPEESGDPEIAMRVVMPDSVVVTASRYPEAARQTGRRVTVLTREDLAVLPVLSVDEFLTSVAGLDVVGRGGFGVQSDLSIRGSTFNGVLLLVDGARINDPMTGHFLMDLPIPIAEIARVEVLRGPAAAIYGPDALGGVVHIITRTAQRYDAARDDGSSALAGFRYGDYGLYDINLSGRSVQPRTTASAAASLEGANGQPVLEESGEVLRNPEGDQVRTDFTRRVGTAAVNHTVGSASLYTRVGVDDRDFSAYRFYTDFDSDFAREATTTLWAQTRLQNTYATPTPWSVQVSAKQHDDTYTFNPSTPPNEHTSRMVRGQAQIGRRLSTQLFVQGGASGALRGIDSNNLGEHSDATAGAFLRARWQPADSLTLSASTRFDYDTVFGTEVTPQLYAAYNFPRATLRGGIARAVRAPNYVEQYFNTAIEPRGGNIGNPDLKAERAWSGEVGLDVYPSDALTLHGTLFARETTNLIDYARTADTEPFFVARNLLDVTTRGVELEAVWARRISDTPVRVGAGYTGLDADLGGVAAGTEYQYALTSTRHLLQVQASATIQEYTTLGVQAVWKDRLDGATGTDSYGLIHARLDYQLEIVRQPAELSIEVRNLLDTEYSEVFEAPMPGRWVLVGARILL